LTSLPRISIVTPSFNQGAYIEQTITSVLDQGYPNLEYIVIDGGSRDESVPIIRKYSKHLAYWVSEPDGGQTDAINKGFRRTTGDIFNWLNSDDFYAPGALWRVAEGFASPDILVVSGRRRIFGDGFADLLFDPASLKSSLEETLLFGSMDQPSTFFRRPVFESISPLSDSLRYCMDTELWLAFLLRYGQTGVRPIPELLVNARLHDQAKTLASQEEFFWERLKLYRSIAEATAVGEDVVRLFETLRADSWHERDWRVDVALDKEALAAHFARAFEGYAQDPARLAREMASYHLYRQADKQAIKAAMDAVRAGPLRLANYRTLAYCLRTSLRRRLLKK
jgi:glycosyltransferase involved in cell wall biosynthesis